MEAAMSTTPGRGLRGQQLEDSAYIDISRETPVNNRPQPPPQQILQPNQYYSPQVPQGQQFYQQSNMSYDAAYGYHQQIPQQIPQQPLVSHSRQSMNPMHSRRSSITSTTSSSVNRFFRGKMKRGGGGGGDDGDEDEGETEAQPGVDVSFDDIKHLRDRGRYGMSNAPFDTTPYIPTLSTKAPGPGGQISNTQYRKLKTAQMKMAMKTAPVAPRANSLQTPGPYGASPMDSRAMSLNTRPGPMMDNRTMSLNSRPMMYPAPQQQVYPPQHMGYQQSPRAMSFQGPGPRFGAQPMQGSPVMRGSPGFVPPPQQQLPPHQRKGSWSNLPQRGPVMSPTSQQYDPYNNQRQMPLPQQQQRISPQRSVPQMQQQRSQENLSGGQSRTSLKTDSSKEVSPLRNVYSESKSEGADSQKAKRKLNKYSFNMEEDIDEELERLERAKTREIEEQSAINTETLQAAPVAPVASVAPVSQEPNNVTQSGSVEIPQEAHHRSSSTVPSSIRSNSRSYTQNGSASSSIHSTPNKKPSADSLRKHALAANIAPSPQKSFGRRDSLISDLTDFDSPTKGVKQPLYQLSTGTANEVYVTAPELQDVVDEEEEEPEDEVTGLGVITSTPVSQIIEKEPVAPVYSEKSGSQRSLDSTKTLEGNQDSAVSDTDHGSQSFPSGNDTTMEDLSSANDCTMMEEVKSTLQRMEPEQSYTDGSSVIYRPEGVNNEAVTPHSEKTIMHEESNVEIGVPQPPVVQSQVYKSMLFSDDVAPPVPLQARERKASFPPPTSAVMANTTEKLGNPAMKNIQSSSESFESPKIPQTVNRKNSAINLKENSPIMKSVNFFKKVSKKAKERGYKEESAASTPKFGNDFESSPRFNVITTASAGMEGTYSHNYQSYAKHETEMRKGDRSVFLPDVESAPSQKSQSSFDKALPDVPSDSNEFDFGSPKKNSSRTRRPRRSVDTKSIDILNYKLDVDLPAENLSLFSRNSALLPTDMTFNNNSYSEKQLPAIVEKQRDLPAIEPSTPAPIVPEPMKNNSVSLACTSVEPVLVAKDSNTQPVVATKDVHNSETARSTPTESATSSRYVSTQASETQSRQSRAASSESHLRALSAEQLGLLHANEALLDELQSVSNALAESITREYNLEEKLKSGKLDETRSVDENAIKEKSIQIANLSKQLVEERRKRHLAEELCLKWENGLKPSPVELSYQNAELTSKLREQEEKFDQCQQKVESLEAEKPELLRKIQKLTVENKELTTVTIPHLKNSVQVLETGSTVGHSSVDTTELAKENEFLKSQMDLHARVSNDVTMVEQQRDALRDAIKSMREKHEIEMRLANEKIKNLESRVSKFSDISRRKGSGNSEIASPSLRMHTSFQNMRSPSLGTPPTSSQDSDSKPKHTASSSSSSSTKSTPGLNVPVTILNTEI